MPRVISRDRCIDIRIENIYQLLCPKPCDVIGKFQLSCCCENLSHLCKLCQVLNCSELHGISVIIHTTTPLYVLLTETRITGVKVKNSCLRIYLNMLTVMSRIYMCMYMYAMCGCHHYHRAL